MLYSTSRRRHKNLPRSGTYKDTVNRCESCKKPSAQDWLHRARRRQGIRRGIGVVEMEGCVDSIRVSQVEPNRACAVFVVGEEAEAGAAGGETAFKLAVVAAADLSFLALRF